MKYKLNDRVYLIDDDEKIYFVIIDEVSISKDRVRSYHVNKIINVIYDKKGKFNSVYVDKKWTREYVPKDRLFKTREAAILYLHKKHEVVAKDSIELDDLKVGNGVVMTHKWQEQVWHVDANFRITHCLIIGSRYDDKESIEYYTVKRIRPGLRGGRIILDDTWERYSVLHSDLYKTLEDAKADVKRNEKLYESLDLLTKGPQ